MIELLGGITNPADHRIKGPGDMGQLARVENKRYGAELGVRKILIPAGGNDTSLWYPAKKNGFHQTEIDRLRQIQESAFGSFSPAEVIREVLYEGKGEVYVDQPDIPWPFRPQIYAIVIDKPLNEEAIQEELTRIDVDVSSGNLPYHFPGYFTDHNGLDYPAEWPELYEIGRDRNANSGIATDFLRLVKKAYEVEHGKKPWWAIVRVNNIASLKALMRGLGVTATRLQASPGEGMSHFSEETNLGVDSTVAPLRRIPWNSHPEVWDPTKPVPSGKDFLIRMPQGDESKLKSWRPHIAMLRKVMAVGKAPTRGEHYVMRKVLDNNELERLGVKQWTTPHLFFTRNW